MAIVLDGTTNTVTPLNGALGGTTPSTVVATTITGTDLTTTGNTILGNASADTLNVGNGDLVKNASGQILVGNVTPFYDTKVNVIGNNGFYAEVVQASGGAFQAKYTAGSGTSYYGYWLYGASVVGSISSTGTITTYNTSSDYRLKENIAPMTGALNKVALLKPVTYTWKVNGSAGEGFIAHELQEVLPQAVTGDKDAVNADGSIEPQGIDTSYLVATLTAAIQELNAKFEAYKASHP